MGTIEDFRITRRGVVLGASATGLGLLSTGCSASSRDRLLTSVGRGPEWLSSEELADLDGEDVDLTALNRDNGLVLGKVLQDPYGPYLPLRMPRTHPFLSSKPVATLPESARGLTLQEWHQCLARVAPVMVSHLMDPEILWRDDATLEFRWNDEFGRGMMPRASADQEEVPLVDVQGEDKIFNTTGSLEKHLGAHPVLRSTPGPRSTITDLTWSHGLNADGNLAIRLTMRSLAPVVTPDGRPWNWFRTMDLETTAMAEPVTYQFGARDHLGVGLKDAARSLPALRLVDSHHASGRTHHVARLRFDLPEQMVPVARRSDDSPGVVRFAQGVKNRFLVLPTPAAQRGSDSEHGWNVLPGLMNTRFSLSTGQLGFAEWGDKLCDGSYGCRVWIRDEAHDYHIEFTTTAQDAAEQLRAHASTWRIAP